MTFREFFQRIFAPKRSTVQPHADINAATDRPTPEWIVIGLGNPDNKYARNRHNVGYMAVDALLGDVPLIQRRGLPVREARLRINQHEVAVLRSTTYMNNSGESIAPIAEEYGIAADHIIILHDELDLPHGTVRIKKGGNENGHNGLKSSSALLNTRDYLRIRMGISRPPQGMSVPDYVLGDIEHDEALDSMISRSTEAVRLIVTEGIARAQNTIHSA